MKQILASPTPLWYFQADSFYNAVWKIFLLSLLIIPSAPEFTQRIMNKMQPCLRGDEVEDGILEYQHSEAKHKIKNSSEAN